MDENTNVNQEQEATENTENEKTYTIDEVNKLLQSEADRRVSQALAKQKKEYEKKMNLAGLDEAQREKAESQMRIKELEDQLAQFTVEKNKSELKSVLSSRGLSAEFADIISISDDIEASQRNIDTLDKLFKAAVKAEVEKRLSGKAPNAGLSEKQYTKENVKKMSLAEMNELAQKNPKLFDELFN